MISLDKIIGNVKGAFERIIPKRKKKEAPIDPDIQYIKDNIESLKYYVKYQAVFKAVVMRISSREVEALDKNQPCRFRERTEVPFVVVCACKIDGQNQKTLNQCENCKYRADKE